MGQGRVGHPWILNKRCVLSKQRGLNQNPDHDAVGIGLGDPCIPNDILLGEGMCRGCVGVGGASEVEVRSVRVSEVYLGLGEMMPRLSYEELARCFWPGINA